ncbi:MAG: T9SS type A sorting domain-containing protein [Bacteroidota bacterium]
MKKIFTIFLFYSAFIWLNAQTDPIKGVTALGGNLNTTSFAFEDNKGQLWVGLSALAGDNSRVDNGMAIYRNGNWEKPYTTGRFNGAVQEDSTILVTSYEGTYQINPHSTKINYDVTKGNCILFHQSQLWIGTMGNGLYKRTTSGYKKVDIVIANQQYDSILSMETDGNNLWLGTTNGIIKYDGTAFTRFVIPVKNDLPHPYYKRLQNQIISIKCDKNKVIWAMNANIVDSIECLYLIQNGTVVSANNALQKNCGQAELLPYTGHSMGKDQWGNIIIGMHWGYLLINNLSVEVYPITYNIDRISDLRNAYKALIYCNKYGDIFTLYYMGRPYKIQTSLYDINDYLTILNTYRKTAIEKLDINNIKISVVNNSSAFNKMDLIYQFMQYPTFVAPSVSCATPMYSSGLWLGGRRTDLGKVLVAAQTYSQVGSDFLPGPLDTVTGIFDSVKNMAYNKIWKIDRQTIDGFKLNYKNSGYSIPKSINDWPAHGNGNFSRHLAPFIDTDNNGIYEPTKGDYPDIKGDQMLWWVFNDGRPHNDTKGESMGLEIHGSCYAYYNIAMASGDTNSLINRSIFFNYKIINRSKFTYDSFRIGIFNDPDLGYYGDDRIASDTLNNAVICYNGDNFDEGKTGFGKNPPLVLCKFLNRKMDAMVAYNNTSGVINGNPDNDSAYFYYMKGLFQNGQPMKFLDPLTNTLYNSRFSWPASFCSPSNLSSSGSQPGDRRCIMSTNGTTLSASKTTDITYVYTLLHDPSKDFLKENCDTTSKVLKKLQYWYDTKSFPSKPYFGVGVNDIPNKTHDITVYPNPANTSITLSSTIPGSQVQAVVIYDVSGRELLQLSATGTSELFQTTISIADWPAGLYIVQMISDNGSITKKLIKY